MSYCRQESNEDYLIESVTEEIEKLLKEQVGDFAFVQITDKSGKTKLLTSSTVKGMAVKDESALSNKRINFIKAESELRILYSGSPNCLYIPPAFGNGSSTVLNLDGGDPAECLSTSHDR